MMRIIWILALFSVITNATANIASYPPRSGWLFDVGDEPVVEQSKKERSLCETNQCKTLAKMITQSMNESVDPCDDFYEYACGNWKNHNPLPEGEKRWNLLEKIRWNVDKRLQEILDEDSNNSLSAVKLARRAYKACMDTDKLERVGVQPILSTLWRIGGWPLIMEEDEWAEEIYKWKKVDDYYAHLIGLHSLFDITVGQFHWGPSDLSVVIDTPHLPYKLYRLLQLDEIETDSSDENNDSQEGSEERGSEERRDSKEDESDKSDDEGDDDEELQTKFIAKKRTNKQLGPNKRTHNKVKQMQKHFGKPKMKKRTTRAIVKAHGHKKGQLKQRKVTHHATKRRKRVLNRKQMTLGNHVKESVRRNNLRNRRKENTNNDIYFITDNNEDSGDIDPEEDDDVNNDNEQDEKDGSGDDDTDWDNESGSGSGSGSNDYDDTEENDEEGDSEEYEDKSDREAKELRKIYREFMLNVSSVLAQARGVPIPKEKLAEDVEELLQFQVTLLKLMINSEKEMNTTLRLLQESYDALNTTTNKSKINWIRTVQDFFTIAGMEIDADIPVAIPSFEYIEGVRKLLDETPSRIVVNYIHWNFVSRVIKDTTREMRDLYYNWSGNEPQKGRSKECIDEVEAKYCLGYEYVKRYFSDDILQTASDMIDDIEKEVEHEIEKSTWMDDDTKDFILDKLVYLKKILGYPNMYRNDTAMRQYMRGLSISPSHYENKLGIMRHVKREKLKKLFQGIDIYGDFIDPLVVNAFFIPFGNFIEITAADFQSPMFDSHQPWYTNFGIIGLIIGHEINHGFDDAGHLFDKSGEYVQWLSAMAEAYEKRADCFGEQYTRYSVMEKRTGNMSIEDYGKTTLGENIADSMGLEAVFRAYRRRQRECKNPDPMLPGLQNFTNEQMFFLSFAGLWCEVMDPEMLVTKLKHDSHSLGALRVIGPVSNSEDFAKAFNCPEGSPMNPKKKCNIWI